MFIPKEEKKHRIIKNISRFLLLVVLLSFVCFLVWLYNQHTVSILMYHRFGYKESALYVTPENFEKQLKFLVDNDYNVIPLKELVDGIKNGTKFGRNTVVITIDDGYKDVYTYAYPLLKKYGIPATVFVISGFISTEKDFMSWRDVVEMAENNIDIGGHTDTNKYIPDVTTDEMLLQETAGCKQKIEEQLGKTILFFCYPSGGFTEKAKIFIKKAGYVGACTTNRGLVKLNKDVYELKRVKVKDGDGINLLSFNLKLTGYYNVFKKYKRGW